MEGMEAKVSRPMTTAGDSAAKAHSRRKVLQHWLETISTVLLAVTALATSWSGYQASRWGSVQTAKNVEAVGLRIEATRAFTTAGQLQAIDIGLFTNWLNAYAAGKTELETFYRQRFRPEFKPAFEAWVNSHPRKNPNAAPSPFHLPEYRLAVKDKATELEDQAAQAIRDSEAANQQSDEYVRTAVILATVLFFAGISQQIRSVPLQAAMLVVAAVMCLMGLYIIAISAVT